MKDKFKAVETVQDSIPSKQGDDPNIKDKLFGKKEVNPFGTEDLAEFQEKLDKMDYLDKIELASKLGINTRIVSYRMKNAILDKFKEQKRQPTHAEYKERVEKMSRPMSSENSKKVQEILRKQKSNKIEREGGI